MRISACAAVFVPQTVRMSGMIIRIGQYIEPIEDGDIIQTRMCGVVDIERLFKPFVEEAGPMGFFIVLLTVSAFATGTVRAVGHGWCGDMHGLRRADLPRHCLR